MILVQGQYHLDTLLAHKIILSVQVFWEKVLKIKKRTHTKPGKHGNKFKNQYKHKNQGIYTRK